MAELVSWFRVDSGAAGLDGEILVPEPLAGSDWAHGSTLRGMAVSAVLARAVENAVPDALVAGMRPTRWTVDLSRPVAARRLRARARILRQGRRLCLVDSWLEQGGDVVARGRALLLLPSESSAGRVWQPVRLPRLPPPDILPSTREPRIYLSEDVGWTSVAAPHQNDSRKQTWHWPVAAVTGEEPTAFQLVAAVADVASVVGNWGDAGLEHVNADLSLSISRLPSGQEIGLSAAERTEDHGISISTALVHDREGVLGVSTVCAIATSGASVDPRGRDSTAR